MSLILGLGISPGGGNDYPLQYSCQKNPIDRGAWQAAVHRIAKIYDWALPYHGCSPLPSWRGKYPWIQDYADIWREEWGLKLHDEAERKKQKTSCLSNFLENQFSNAKDRTLWKTSNTSLLKRDWEETSQNVNWAGFSVTKMHKLSFYSPVCSVFSIHYLGEKKASFFKWFFFFHNDHVIRYRNFESLCYPPRTNTVL